MKDFKITLSINTEDLNARLNFENISNNCYLLSAMPLMLDGEMRQDNFIVLDKNSSENLIYQGISAKSLPNYIKFKAGQKLSTEVNLNSFYDLENNKTYAVHYEAAITYSPCSDLAETTTELVASNHCELILLGDN